MKETILLNYFQLDQIIDKNECKYLENINIHDYEFIVGPYFMDSHWYAVIIDIKKHQFYFIDPKGTQDDLLQCKYDRWVEYYNSRADRTIKVWHKMTINHPIQTDNCNCAIFVINFIYFYVTTGKINFSTTNMMNWRTLVADSIRDFCE